MPSRWKNMTPEQKKHAVQRVKEWKDDRPGKVAEYQRNYRKKNPEKLRAYYREYYRTHKEQYKAYKEKCRNKKKEAISEINSSR
jgi:vacuolar-type H+-ATPase subunit H